MFLPTLTLPNLYFGPIFYITPACHCRTQARSLFSVTPCCQIRPSLSKLLQLFVNVLTLMSRLRPVLYEIVTCSRKRCYVHLSKLLHAFVKVCTYISHPKANKTMFQFEEYFQDWQTFCRWMEAKFSQNFLSYAAICKSTYTLLLIFYANIIEIVWEWKKSLNKPFVLLIEFNNYINLY